MESFLSHVLVERLAAMNLRGETVPRGPQQPPRVREMRPLRDRARLLCPHRSLSKAGFRGPGQAQHGSGGRALLLASRLCFSETQFRIPDPAGAARGGDWEGHPQSWACRDQEVYGGHFQNTLTRAPAPRKHGHCRPCGPSGCPLRTSEWAVWLALERPCPQAGADRPHHTVTRRAFSGTLKRHVAQ